MSFKIGFGFDVHPFKKGRKLIIGGVEIPFEKGLDGYSDADVLCHAIADALLGAAALGDIGRHFPNSDPLYKDISSLLLLNETYNILQTSGYEVVNIDSTLVMEEPKLSSYILDMKRNISQSLKIDLESVSIKATTSEGLGYIGRGEGVAAYAISLIQKINK